MTIDRDYAQAKEELYFPISPFMIFPEAYGDFSIYVKKGKHFVLYSRKGELFTERHKTILYENGVEEVYIRSTQRPGFDDYVEQNLARVLLDDAIPIPVRSKVFYCASKTLIKDIMQSKLPGPLNPELHKRLLSVVTTSVRFFCNRNALKAVAALMSHDYQTFTHSSNVFIYTLSILETYHYANEEKTHIGLGALLHDVGKLQIPTTVLNKPGKLNNEEWEMIKAHPIKGVGLCSLVPLHQTAINCILFHHEKCDGTGYPAGLNNEDIPLAAKVVSVADVYDAITSRRPYADAVTPFKALTIMREDMKGSFDDDVFKRFVLILSGANIV